MMNESHAIALWFLLALHVEKLLSSQLSLIARFMGRARRFPLPNSPRQVKLPVGQVDLNRLFLFISYKQMEEFQNSWSQASDDFEKMQTLMGLT